MPFTAFRKSLVFDDYTVHYLRPGLISLFYSEVK